MAKLKNSSLSSVINRANILQILDKPVKPIVFSCGFFLRDTNKVTSKSKSFIYMFLRNGKSKLAFSTGLQVDKAFFEKEGKVSNNSAMNLTLLDMRMKAEMYAAELKITGRAVDLSLIKAIVLGHVIETIPNVKECIALFQSKVIDELYEIGDIEKSSYKKLQGWNRHIERWLNSKLGKGVRLDQISPAEANHFLYYLKGTANLSNNVAYRIVAHLKRILNYAVENEWIVRNPFMNFRKKLERKKQDFLNEKEIEVLERTKFASIPLAQLRDMFLFQCYTSLSFNELKELTPDHISLVDGYHCIRIRRKKTDHSSNIEQIVPLVPQALELLEAYRSHPVCKHYNRCFPVQSNQKYNALLKQVGMITGISKRLTSHVGRRTAATHYLKHGVPLVSVSAMLGHATTEMTETHYAFRQPEMVVRDFHRFLSK